jgi:hypothetical protein
VRSSLDGDDGDGDDDECEEWALWDAASVRGPMNGG